MQAALHLLFCLALTTADRLEDLEKKLEYQAAEIKIMKEYLDYLVHIRDALAKTATKNGDLEARVAKLETLAKVNVLRSCAEYSQLGVSNSGLFLIDPDGPLLGEPPFQVRSKMFPQMKK